MAESIVYIILMKVGGPCVGIRVIMVQTIESPYPNMSIVVFLNRPYLIVGQSVAVCVMCSLLLRIDAVKAVLHSADPHISPAVSIDRRNMGNAGDGFNCLIVFAGYQ